MDLIKGGWFMKSFMFAFAVVFSILFCPLPTEAAEIEDVVYSDVSYHIGEGETADWITRAIMYASATYGVDPLLVTAVMEQESGFTFNAVSSAGAVGLMQLMPSTAAAIGVDPYNPLDNIMGGVLHLRTLLDSFANWGMYAVTVAVAAYNAGSDAVIRAAGVPNYSETRNYVVAISNNYNRLISMLG